MSKGDHVYVAGPMSWGSGIDNILAGVNAGDRLMAVGEVPFIPHISHFWALMNGNRWTHEQWLAYDKYWVLSAKALIRLPGKSRGADQEVRWARRHGIKVYKSVEDYIDENGLNGSD